MTRFNPLPVPTTTPADLRCWLSVPERRVRVRRGEVQAGGWPVLIFQHGITRNREDMFAVADSFADTGFVVVAIDLPLHGITNQSDPLVRQLATSSAVRRPRATRERLHRGAPDLDLRTTPPRPVPGVIDPSGFLHFAQLGEPPDRAQGQHCARASRISSRSRARCAPEPGAAGSINPLLHSLPRALARRHRGRHRSWAYFGPGRRRHGDARQCRAARSRSCATRRRSRRS